VIHLAHLAAPHAVDVHEVEDGERHPEQIYAERFAGWKRAIFSP